MSGRLSTRATDDQLEIIAQHFEKRLLEIGVEENRQSDFPGWQPIFMMLDSEWQEEEVENATKWGYVRAYPISLTEYLSNLRFQRDQSPERDDAQFKRLPMPLEEIGITPLNGTCLIGLLTFKLCAGPLSYQKLFRVAIHEGAHVAHWYECMKATGNRFTEEDLIEFEKSAHGKDFNRIDSLLLKPARKLGYRKPGVIPEEIADLFTEPWPFVLKTDAAV
jgi:hypothetical protein